MSTSTVARDRKRERDQGRERAALLLGLGGAVRARRLGKSWSLRELAAQAGVSVRFLAELEAGRGNISVGRLHELARALDTRASTLIEAGERRGRRVALLGLRGAGKSTIGRRLAKRLQVPFVELDSWVEERAGMSLGALFELHGEAFYRRLEREALRAVLDAHETVVIAAGGSLVEDDETFALLRDHATTVWLKATPDSHWERVVAQGDRRPMANRANAKAELRALLRARAERYARADVEIDTDAMGVERAMEAIAERVDRSSDASAL